MRAEMSRSHGYRPIDLPGSPMLGTVSDLFRRELTLLLLLDENWRQRRVETIVPIGPYYYRSRVSLQLVLSQDTAERAIDVALRRLWQQGTPSRIW